jgi:hypothetical protein
MYIYIYIYIYIWESCTLEGYTRGPLTRRFAAPRLTRTADGEQAISSPDVLTVDTI